MENSIPVSLQPFQTANGIQLSHPDNASIVSKIGEELLLFSDYCQHRSSWRRRGYLVVVNELTRIFHTSFPHAQIEVCFCSRRLFFEVEWVVVSLSFSYLFLIIFFLFLFSYSLVIWVFSHRTDDSLFGCGFGGSRQY